MSLEEKTVAWSCLFLLVIAIAAMAADLRRIARAIERAHPAQGESK